MTFNFFCKFQNFRLFDFFLDDLLEEFVPCDVRLTEYQASPALSLKSQSSLTTSSGLEELGSLLSIIVLLF